MRDFVFMFLVAVVLAGVAGILFANYFVAAGKDAKFGSGYSDLGYYSTPYYNDNASYTSEYFPNEGQAGKKSATRDSKPNAELEKLRQKVEKLAPQIADTQSALADIKSHLDSIEDSFERTNKDVESLRHDLSKGSQKQEFLLTALATRIGIAAAILLLVKILTSIYRYHARLAAHFDSKADALELCPVGDVVVLEKLCLALSTAGVDFQESADSIAEHAVEIARKVAPGSHS